MRNTSLLLRHDSTPIGSEPAASEAPRRQFSTFTAWSVAAARLLLGAVFTVSGIVKVLDAATFLKTIPFYQLPDGLYPVAFAVPSAEVALGVSLLLGLERIRTAQIAIGVLAIFSALIAYGLLRGDLETCGCFGQILEMSPAAALGRNALLIAVAGFVWYGSLGRARTGPLRLWPVWTIAVLLQVTGILTALSAYSPMIDQSRARLGAPFPTDGFIETPDLRDHQLIFLFHPRCLHCWNYVNNVKALAADPEFDVLAVTHASAADVDAFARDFEINFRVFRFQPKAFLSSFRSWPALYYLEDGRIRGKVETAVPAPKAVHEIYLPRWQRTRRARL